MRILPISAAVSFMALSACAEHTPPLATSEYVTAVQGSVLPAPADPAKEISLRPYIIGPQDKLRIDSIGIEDFKDLKDLEITVDSNGYISYPIAGAVRAAGKTPAELQTLLEERLRAGHVRNPTISINLEKAESQIVTIDGDVTEPGLYPVTGGMTLMRAVASAKGVSEFAKLQDVVVFRTVGGQRYAALYNLAAIRKGYYGDPDIYPNDVIVVGDSKSKRLFDNILKASGLITTPIIALIQTSRL